MKNEELVIENLKDSLKLYRSYGEESYEKVGNFHYFTLDRFRRHDHGGGEDGDDWLSEHEINQDYEEGEKKHFYQLDKTNKILKENGFKSNALFNLGEKGHFSIVFDLVKNEEI